MKNFVLGVLIVLSGFAFADSAEAQAACFTWSCNTNTQFCTFNANCSDPTPLNYQWTWGDGSTGSSFSPNASHAYAAGTFNADVTLSAGYLFIGYYDVTCNVKMRNVIGPPVTYLYGTCS